MRSIRLCSVVVVALVAVPLAGCGHSLDAGWPAGSEAIVSDPEGGGTTAGVPLDQQTKCPRRLGDAREPNTGRDRGRLQTPRSEGRQDHTYVAEGRPGPGQDLEGRSRGNRSIRTPPGACSQASCRRVGDFLRARSLAAVVRRGWGSVDDRHSLPINFENALGPDRVAPRNAAPSKACEPSLASPKQISIGRAHRRGLRAVARMDRGEDRATQGDLRD